MHIFETLERKWMSLILNILEYYQDIIIVHQVGDAESSLTKKLLTSVLSDDLLQQLRIAMRLDLVHLGLFSNETNNLVQWEIIYGP